MYFSRKRALIGWFLAKSNQLVLRIWRDAGRCQVVDPSEQDGLGTAWAQTGHGSGRWREPVAG